MLAAGTLPVHVLDLGAGSGWLSHRLAALGHRAVAVDAIDDEVDGLGAARHYPTDFASVQADFDALPFAPGQFDLVVFNGSLHYAADTAATLERAHRAARAGGALVVMDSPMFRADGDGSAMVGAEVLRFRNQCGCANVVQPGVGYLTFARLAGIAGEAGAAAAVRPVARAARLAAPPRRRPRAAAARAGRVRPVGGAMIVLFNPISTTPGKQPLPLSLMSLAAVLEARARGLEPVSRSTSSTRGPSWTATSFPIRRPRSSRGCRPRRGSDALAAGGHA